MKMKRILSIVILFCVTLTGFAQNKNTNSLKFRFATRAEAQMLLTDIDNFSNGLNQFDIDIRLQKTNSRKSEWLRLAMNEAKNWSDVEKEKISSAFKTIKKNIQQLKLNLTYPDEIVLLKTTMKEELNMVAYTRKQWIAIGEDFITQASNEQLQSLISHELFHLLTRKSVAFKRAAYATIGFTVLEQEIALPSDVIAKRISNPDIERRDSYIELTVDGELTKCVQIIYASKSYTEGGIQDYLNVGFIPLNEELIPRMKDGQTVIIPADQMTEEFQQKVGTNTNYTIDPEEVLADNFSFLLTLKKDIPSANITNALQKICSTK